MSFLHSAAEPFHDLVQESLREATFLWRRWESELSSLTRNLDEVWSCTEDRLHGALAGVRVGAGGVEVATNGLLPTTRPNHRQRRCAISSADRQVIDAVPRRSERPRTKSCRRWCAVWRCRIRSGAESGGRRVSPRGDPPVPERCAGWRAAVPATMVTAFTPKIPRSRSTVRAAFHGPSRRGTNGCAALRSDDARGGAAAVESGVSVGLTRRGQPPAPRATARRGGSPT